VKVSIIGSGIVGTATGMGLAKLGHSVIFYDTNENRLKELCSERLEVGRNISDVVMSTSISFICVPTPTVKGATDPSSIRDTLISVSKPLRKKKDYHLIVVRSTLLPGTTRKVIVPLLRKRCNTTYGEGYGVCYNPEFLRQASALEDFLNPSRIVIGEADRKSGDTLEEIYSPLGAPMIRTDFDTAEMIKHVSNAFLATKISFFNEIYMICKKLNIDHRLVSEGVSLDPRIGKYGVQGGRPFAGGCLPKDVEAFTRFLESLNLNPDILKVVLDINKDLAKKTHVMNKQL